MSAPSVYIDMQQWPDDTAIDPFSTTWEDTSQLNHTGWLLGDTVEGQAPPASWAGLASRPHVEEFVPPNPPKALGVSDGRMLMWPTLASRDGAAETNVKDVDDRSTLMQLPYFRQRVLKHDQKAVEEKQKGPVRSLPRYDSGIVQHDEHGNGRCVKRDRRFHGAKPYHFDGGQPALPPFSRPCKSARKHVAGPQQQRSMHKPQIHVQKEYSGHTSIASYRYPLPEALTSYLPKLIRPSNPAQLQLTLKAMKPTIVYTRYSCDSGCRSRGICVHFSFVLGGRCAPDGLICDQCLVQGKARAVDADRECARHVNGRVYLAEDILVTDVQAERAREVLRRALACEWEGVPERMWREDGEAVSTVGNQHSSVLPVCSLEGKESGWSNAIPSHADKQPCAKKARLGDHSTVSILDNRYNLEGHHQDDFAQYPIDLNDGLTFDDMVSPDFTALMTKPNGGFGNADAGC